MVMGVVAEMRGVRLLMLAIHSRCRPGILEWQSEQQQDEKVFFHGMDNSTCDYVARRLRSFLANSEQYQRL